MLSFKEYRNRDQPLEEQEAAGAPVTHGINHQSHPQYNPPHQYASTDLEGLKSQVSRVIVTSLDSFMARMKVKNPQTPTPIDTMRKALPWGQKIKNWWHRFWNNDDSKVESQEYGLEFGDDNLNEVEAYRELEIIFNELFGMKGTPINDAITNMGREVETLKHELLTNIGLVFANHKPVSQAQQAPTEAPRTPEPSTSAEEPPKPPTAPSSPAQTEEEPEASTDDPTDQPGEIPPAPTEEPDDLGDLPPIPNGEPDQPDEELPPAPTEEPEEAPSPEQEYEPATDASAPLSRPQAPQPPDPPQEPVEAPHPQPLPQQDEPEQSQPKRRGRPAKVKPADESIDAPITDIKNGQFDYADSVEINGHNFQITWVKYANNGDLKEIKIADRFKPTEGPEKAGIKRQYGGRWLKVPDELGKRLKSIDRAGNIGEKAKLIANMRAGIPNQVHDDSVLPPQVHAPRVPNDNIGPVAPHNHVGVPDIQGETPHSMAHVPKYSSPAPRNYIPDDIGEWYGNQKVHLKPELEKYMTMPDGPPKESVMKFIDGLRDEKNLFFGGKMSSTLMDNTGSLDRLEMISELHPNEAKKLAALMLRTIRQLPLNGIIAKERAVLKEKFAPVFADLDSLRNWIQTTNEHALNEEPSFVDKLRTRAKKKSIKDLSFNEQVKKYKRKIKKKD
jgi:hypothetical protein